MGNKIFTWKNFFIVFFILVISNNTIKFSYASYNETCIVAAEVLDVLTPFKPSTYSGTNVMTASVRVKIFSSISMNRILLSSKCLYDVGSEQEHELLFYTNENNFDLLKGDRFFFRNFYSEGFGEIYVESSSWFFIRKMRKEEGYYEDLNFDDVLYDRGRYKVKFKE